LKYSTYCMDIEPPSRVASYFFNLLDERSGGKVKVKPFWASTLGKDTEQLNLVKTGSVDMATFITEMFPMEIPLTALNAQVLAPQDEALWKVWDLMAERPDTAPLFEEEWKKNNINFIYDYAAGEMGFMLRKPASKLADFKGRLIGSCVDEPGFQEYGMHTKVIAVPDMYEALSRGTVDGMYMALAAFEMLKFHEAGKMYVSPGINNVNVPVVMNLNTWNSLTPELQKIFQDSAMDAMKYNVAEITPKMADHALMVFKDNNIPILTLTPEDQTTLYEYKYKNQQSSYLFFAEKAGVLEQAKIVDKAWHEIVWGK